MTLEKYHKEEPNNDVTENDGIDRRGFLKCMAWAGTGMIWSVTGGVLSSRALGSDLSASATRTIAKPELQFVQISDSHIGFSKPANMNVAGTLQKAVDKINSGPGSPAFVIHTGDISHLATADQFDGAEQILKDLKTDRIHYVPGEHDVLDQGKVYMDRFGKNTKGDGWYSFNEKGIHFVGLVNVVDLQAKGLGNLGKEQLEWLDNDVKGLSSSTPIVVFAHIPLWSVYPDWGWGTQDSEQALSYLKRFGSVTVLNGHIHQTLSKVEGNVSFHTAMSTAFPQPAPGNAPSPGPMKVADDQLASVLGVTSINYVRHHGALGIVDTTLAS